MALDVFLFAGSFIGQHNEIVVGPSGNTAIANTRRQRPGERFAARRHASARWRGRRWWLGRFTRLFIALAFSGDADAVAANQSDSSATSRRAADAHDWRRDGAELHGRDRDAGERQLRQRGRVAGACLRRHRRRRDRSDQLAPRSTSNVQRRRREHRRATRRSPASRATAPSRVRARWRDGGWAGALGALALAVAGDAVGCGASTAR